VSAVAELPLDLDAFEGPFDLLLTLVLKEELVLADVEIVEIVLAFLAERAENLEVDGEFLVLVAALLELKARGLFPEEDEAPFEDLDPDDAAGELAERLAQYRRFRSAAGWLEEKLERESDRYFRLGPAPLAPVPKRTLPPQEPILLANALRALAVEPPAPSLRHITLTFPPVSLFLERFRAVLRRRGRFVFDREVDRLTRVEQAVAFLALLELRKAGEIAIGQAAPFEEITVWNNAR
jgi:segregation and condensation protein A